MIRFLSSFELRIPKLGGGALWRYIRIIQGALYSPEDAPSILKWPFRRNILQKDVENHCHGNLHSQWTIWCASRAPGWKAGQVSWLSNANPLTYSSENWTQWSMYGLAARRQKSTWVESSFTHCTPGSQSCLSIHFEPLDTDHGGQGVGLPDLPRRKDLLPSSQLM